MDYRQATEKSRNNSCYNRVIAVDMVRSMEIHGDLNMDRKRMWGSKEVSQ